MTDTRTMTLVEFLTARLDEDEAVARAASGGAWAVGVRQPLDIRGDDMVIYDEGGHTVEHAAHIARHDPARVLREVEAKRRIVEQWQGWATGPPDDLPVDGSARFTLRALASAYSDHPEYDPAWT